MAYLALRKICILALEKDGVGYLRAPIYLGGGKTDFIRGDCSRANIDVLWCWPSCLNWRERYCSLAYLHFRRLHRFSPQDYRTSADHHPP